MNPLSPRNPAAVFLVVLLLGAGIALQFAMVATGARLQKLEIQAKDGLKFHTLPAEIEGWERLGSDPPPLSAEVLETLGTSNYLSRTYISTTGLTTDAGDPAALELHCAYYTGTIDTVPHVPERCYVGGGMSIAGGSRVIEIPLELDRFPFDPYLRGTAHEDIRRGRTSKGAYVRLPRGVETLKMNVTPFLTQDGRKVFAGYFFLANGGMCPTADDVRLLAFQLKDSYAYYAKVQLLSVQVESFEEFARLAGAFLNEMFPEIMLRVPDWVEVLEGRYPEDSVLLQSASDSQASLFPLRFENQAGACVVRRSLAGPAGAGARG